ncbi:hypothetical protein C5167_047310 [Papaver somniferum]|uniref:4Fe-4S ferredoxin-type domain-containing protein n=1 Tax=Papaver somniferum TaxID=3469 RepID=A0A4Y7LII9_PAPSO|nr:hypothetical protein C5167_047310 [Papaver somniferum]
MDLSKNHLSLNDEVHAFDAFGCLLSCSTCQGACPTCRWPRNLIFELTIRVLRSRSIVLITPLRSIYSY